MEYYSAFKRNELLIYTWIKLRYIVGNNRNQNVIVVTPICTFIEIHHKEYLK